MSQADDIQEKLMAIFQEELKGHLDTLNRGIITLEQGNGDAALLADLFRAAHSLKGAARAVSLRDIEMMAHRLEDALGLVRKEDRALNQAHFDAVLAVVDAIQEAMSARMNGEQIPAEKVSDILERLDQAMASEPHQQAAAEVLPEPPAEKAGAPPAEPAVEPAAAAQLPPSPPAPPVRLKAVDETIRVSTSKLDALMDNLGELLVVRMRTEKMLEKARQTQEMMNRWQKDWRKTRPVFNRLHRNSGQVAPAELAELLAFISRSENEMKMLRSEVNQLIGQLVSDSSQLQLVTDDLQNSLRSTRMLPVSSLFDIFPRMVRDLAHEQGKEIILRLEGSEIEVDRQALDLIKDPLIHLLRNAVDHGIESPQQRDEAGKPRQGVILLRAEQKGTNLVLEVTDDGAGIDLAVVRKAAVEKRIISPAQAEKLDEKTSLELIFRSGFSTARNITDISGRGIGMDVVRENLEQMRGYIRMETHPGRGTSFFLTVPVSLATTQVLIVRAAGETLGLPMINVARILQIRANQLGVVDGQPAVVVDGCPLTLVDLAQALGLPAENKTLASTAKVSIVIMSVVEKRVALRVDGFMSTQEVMVKNLGRQLRRVRNISGATILGDGQLVMVLNPADVFKSIQAIPSAALVSTLVSKTPARRRVLLADDSITTRSLEKHILENAGFQVSVAANGMEAWQLLNSPDGAGLDALVSDVNMPEMDGFELAAAVKASDRLAHLPVLLVTSLETQQDKLRGMESGADAYIVKSSFDQRELLEALDRLIG